MIAATNKAATGRIAAVIAIVVLALLGYWAFTAIEKQRKLQKCIDEGRRSCVEIPAPPLSSGLR